VVKLISKVRAVHVSAAVKQYVVDIITATRASSELRLGGSPRATLHLVRAARASAALDGRDYVLPDDVQGLAGPVLAHRLLTTAEAQIARRTATTVLADIVRKVPLPTGR
jgi:MoxR-like ATPase